MKVKVLVEFYDLKEDVLRSEGEIFEVSESRYDEIIRRGGSYIEKISTTKATTKKEGAKNDGERRKETSRAIPKAD